MRGFIAVVLLVSSCVLEPADEPPAAAAWEATPDLAEARFFARPVGEDVEEALWLPRFGVEVLPGRHTVRTHVGIEVENPGPGQREAHLRLPVPPGAAVTRAVLHVDGRPMEGAFVARERARAIYRSITARRRDPALITWAGPEWVEISIFPVEARGRRVLELEWIEPAAVVGGRIQVRVPVIAHRGNVIGWPAHVVLPEGRSVPVPRPGLVAVGSATPAAAAARQPGSPFGLVLARAAAAPATQPAAPPAIVVVVETSAAMSLAARRVQRDALDELLAGLPAAAHVTVLRADWTVEVLAEQTRPTALGAALDALDAIPSAGPLDLERALLAACRQAAAVGAGTIVFVGGGADAFGGDGLAAPLRCLREARQRLVAVGVPAVPAPLADLASLTGGRACAATELPRPRTLAALAAPAPATLAATAATAELGGVESWEPLETVTGEVAWIGRIAGALPPADRVGADDLEALWARARIGRGDADDGAGGERIVTPLTSLLVLENDGDYPRWGLPVPRAPRTWWRTARTVASAAAALPAAEAIPEWMKKKGQDDGPGRAGVGRRDRGREPLARAQAAEVGEPARDEARTAGALGVMRPSGTASIFGRDSAIGRDADSALGSLIGNQIGEAYGVGGFGLVGRQGGGSTSEGTVGLGNLGTIGVAPGHRWYAGARQRGSQQPDVVGGQVKTTGGLDRDVIGRTIRSHLKEVKFCYEQELMRRPSLHGRVTVKFAISPTGSVSSSAVDASTVNDARVERCIAQAVQRWEFPKPAGGGVVIVSYPFVLAAGSPVTRPTPARPARPPETEWQVALRILADGAVPLMTRVARIATLLRAKDTSRPEVLGWWLATAHLRAGAPDAEVFLLVSRLLDAAKQARDAVRVLAEGAVRHPDAIARELRRRGRAADAERVQALAARGPR